ncbi:MAG TPA: hypothetical protein PKC30_05325 [Saprospiraceae bacterium]|mgnify:CR=1 FL=1|nr:hypothetical protein [Saprospiraceae bacterium]
MEKQMYFDVALEWVEKRASDQIRVDKEGFEPPRSFVNKNTQEQIAPDITYKTSNGSKHYTDIALKSENPQKLVTKWKLLSTMAQMKNGKLHLLAPRGHKSFATELVNTYNIDAIVHSI